MPTAYLQHGTGSNGSFRIESVPCKESPLPHHNAGLSYTASGYGSRIPSRYMVKYNGRWRRVYWHQYSNAGTAYIGPSLRSGIVVNLYDS